MPRNLIIGLLAFLTLIDLFGAQALLPQLRAKFDVDPSSVGLAVNSSIFGMAVAGVIVVFLSQKMDRMRGIVFSLALLAVPTFLLGFVDDLALFSALRVVQGILMASAFTLTMSYLSEECLATEAATAMAAYITGNVLSNLIGRIMAANFADWFGLSVSFWLFALLNLSGAALAFFCLSSTSSRVRSPSTPTVLEAVKIHLANRSLRTSNLLGFVILFVFLAVFTFVNFVLSQPPFDLSGPQLGLVYIVFIPSLFTTPLAGRLSAKRGVFEAYTVSMLVAVAGLGSLMSSSLVLVLLGLAVVAVGTFCAQAVISGNIGTVATVDRATASGMYLTSYYVGGLAGTAVMGPVFSRLGWNVVLSMLVLVCFLSLLVAAPLRQR
ncbi:MFS transporter [Ruegeria sp. SCPT10]|uniref:MFS transporter n=1 Tax=Ruegeria sp. SCP10 TaxID=3141377 RepID=UPI00333E0B28